MSAAANVGSSRFTAGVPDFDLDLRVDFPKDPVSAITLRARGASGLSALPKKLEISSMIEVAPTHIAFRKAFALHHCLYITHPPVHREWEMGACLDWNLNAASGMRWRSPMISNMLSFRLEVCFPISPRFRYVIMSPDLDNSSGKKDLSV